MAPGWVEGITPLTATLLLLVGTSTQHTLKDGCDTSIQCHQLCMPSCQFMGATSMDTSQVSCAATLRSIVSPAAEICLHEM